MSFAFFFLKLIFGILGRSNTFLKSVLLSGDVISDWPSPHNMPQTHTVSWKECGLRSCLQAALSHPAAPGANVARELVTEKGGHSGSLPAPLSLTRGCACSLS